LLLYNLFSYISEVNSFHPAKRMRAYILYMQSCLLSQFKKFKLWIQMMVGGCPISVPLALEMCNVSTCDFWCVKLVISQTLYYVWAPCDLLLNYLPIFLTSCCCFCFLYTSLFCSCFMMLCIACGLLLTFQCSVVVNLLLYHHDLVLFHACCSIAYLLLMFQNIFLLCCLPSCSDLLRCLHSKYCWLLMICPCSIACLHSCFSCLLLFRNALHLLWLLVVISLCAH